MSASSLMAIGVKAMAANYAALQTTGNNIANANVAGYSRQQVQLVTSPGQFTGAGFMGAGVDVATVTRAHDSFLTSAATAAASLAAMDSARLGQLNNMQQAFQIGTGGLGDSVNQLFSALSAVANNPGDLSARQALLGTASSLAANFNSAGAAFDSAQAGVSSQVASTAAEVNGWTQGIATLNGKIAAALAQGQTPNDLMDQRDTLISNVSGAIQVSRLDMPDGTTSLFVAGGQTLVLGSQSTQLLTTPDSSDPSRVALAVQDGATTRALDSSSLGGGSIAGLLKFQNTDLVNGRNLVGQLATAVAGAINLAQQKGVSLQPPLGTVAGPALFGLPAPVAVPNAGNAKDPATGLALGQVTLSITDPSAVQASSYSLAASTTSPGSWTLTRLSDGTVSTVNSGDVVDGMQINISNAQPGDRYLLQPVAGAADGLSALSSNPLDIAAAAPVVATVAAQGGSTLAVTSLLSSAALAPFPSGPAAAPVAPAAEALTFSLLSPPVVANGVSYNYSVSSSLGGAAVNWNPGQPLQSQNGYTLQLSGAPANGDVINLAATPASAVATNNGNATSMLNLQNVALAAGQTATNAWANAVSSVGVAVQNAQSASDISTAASTQAEQARSSQAGVNLDEEAANLIQYQQSYQAAAKILQVAQAVFDTLLQTASAA